jgi:hypothetical protein
MRLCARRRRCCERRGPSRRPCREGALSDGSLLRFFSGIRPSRPSFRQQRARVSGEMPVATRRNGAGGGTPWPCAHASAPGGVRVSVRRRAQRTATQALPARGPRGAACRCVSGAVRAGRSERAGGYSSFMNILAPPARARVCCPTQCEYRAAWGAPRWGSGPPGRGGLGPGRAREVDRRSAKRHKAVRAHTDTASLSHTTLHFRTTNVSDQCIKSLRYRPTQHNASVVCGSLK